MARFNECLTTRTTTTPAGVSQLRLRVMVKDEVGPESARAFALHQELVNTLEIVWPRDDAAMAMDQVDAWADENLPDGVETTDFDVVDLQSWSLSWA